MGKTRQKANLTSDNLITSNITTDRIGINSSSPISTLDVGGNVNVTGVVTSTGGFSIGISSSGIPITTGSIKTINFVGAGNTFSVDGSTVNVSISSGESSEKTVTRSIATDNQTTFGVTYAVGYLYVYLNGIKQKPSLYAIIPPKTISVTNFTSGDYIEIQYTKLKI